MTCVFTVGSLLAVSLFAVRVRAVPWSNATCTDLLWSFNSRQQSPCLVGAYLAAQCTNDNTWGIPALGPGDSYYSPPTKSQANTCECNSVIWSLLSACSMCQGKSAGSWTEWITNCTNPAVGEYLLPIPSDVTVPHWAYYDFTTAGIFNAVVASQQVGPESSPISTPTATSTSTTQITETPPPSGDKTSKSNNTGAIIGGAVGGALGLALIGLIAFVLVRKNTQNKPDHSTPHHVQDGYNPPIGSQTNTAPVMGQYQPGAQGPGMMPYAGTGSFYKPYDPSDPSTFPSGLNNPATPNSYTESLTYTNQSPTHPVQYNGALHN